MLLSAQSSHAPVDSRPRLTARREAPPEVRFATKYRVDDSGCWRWTDRLSPTGYGHIGIARRLVAAHRFAYEHFVGPIPDGLEIDHLCRVRDCVNPAHLEPVTHAVNVARGDHAAKGANNRRKTHCRHGHAFDSANTFTYTDRVGTHRVCRTCHRLRQAARRADGA